MPEGFSSIAELKIVIDAETEKLTGGLELAQGLLSRFTASANEHLTLFDRVTGGMGNTLLVFAGRLNVVLGGIQAGLALLNQLVAAGEQLAVAAGTEEEFARLRAAIDDLDRALIEGLRGAFQLAATEAADLAESLLGVEGQFASTTSEGRSFVAWLQNELTEKLREVALTARMLAPETQQSADTLEAGMARIRQEIERNKEVIEALRNGLPQLDFWGNVVPSDSEIARLEAANAQLEARLGLMQMLASAARFGESLVAQAERQAAAEKTLDEILGDQVRKLEFRVQTLGATAGAVAALEAERRVMAELERREIEMTDELAAGLETYKRRIIELHDAIDDYNKAVRAREEAERQAAATERIFQQLERERQRIEERAEALMMEEAAVAGLAAEYRALHAIREQGREPTEEEIARIRDLREAIEEQTEAYVQLRDQLRLVQSTGEVVTRSLQSAFRQWAQGAELDVKRMVANILAELAQLTFQRGVLEPLVGGFTSGLSSLFGGARADGGPVQAGQFYLIGERGPELFAPAVDGHIIPAERVGGAITVNMPLIIDAKGAYPESIAEIRTAVEQLRAEVPARTLEVIRESRERGL